MAELDPRGPRSKVLENWVHTHTVHWNGMACPVMLLRAAAVALYFRSDGLIEWLGNTRGQLFFRGTRQAATLVEVQIHEQPEPFGLLEAARELRLE